MRVFVAGATGVIGRRLLPALVEDGHEVVGMTRAEAKADLVRELGAEPAIANAFDADRLRQVVAAARPEVVVHELTDIPSSINPRRFGEQFGLTNRLRREGTRNLVEAARAAGARRIVAQSVAFAYARKGSGLRVEEDPLALDEPPPWGDAVQAVGALEATVTGAEGMEGVVLRYGYFYGPGTSYASDGAQSEMVRRRRFPIVGEGSGLFSFIHVDDAAGATAGAISHGAPGVYNVVDDDPAPVREWLPELARALGAKRPLRVPVFLARVVAGEYAVNLLTRSEGASNRKAKDELGLELRLHSWRRGFVDAPG